MLKMLLASSSAIAATLIGLGVLSLSFSLPASAASKDPFQDCIDHHSMEFAWARCGEDEIMRQERKLTIVWKKSLKCFDETDPDEKAGKRDFIADQLRWENWKDNSCLVYETEHYGAMVPVIGKTCKIDIIAARIKFLQSIANPDGEICAPKLHSSK